MECRHCNIELFSDCQLFFFSQSEKQVHLSLKPELRAGVENDRIVTVRVSSKNVEIHCKTCSGKLGKELPFGPAGSHFIAFGTDKVTLCGRRLSGKNYWRDMLSAFPMITQRSNENFFGTVAPVVESRSVEMKTGYPPIIYASAIDHYDWSLPLSPKYPRDYQVVAFVEALQRDLIVVIPTGSGKTLIASLLLLQMKKLNPKLLGLVIVDRIPLVYQQADVITLDTGLRVCRLCGENRTEGLIRGIRGGSFDVVVATAGCIHEVLKRKALSLQLFACVVFDECHHATGLHCYNDLLNLIYALPSNDRPRILGLTASPFSAKTLTIAYNNLTKFLSIFPGAALFRPEAPRLVQQPVEWELLNTPYVISYYVSEATRLFNELLSGLGASRDRGIILSPTNAVVVKGQLRALKHETLYLSPSEQSAVDTLILILSSIDVAKQIGIQEALSILSNGPEVLNTAVSLLVNEFASHNEVSPKLPKLDSYLRGCTPESRVLVFVDTREICRRLLRYVTEKFQHLNPERIVGHGGHDGMNWEEEQQTGLQNFHDGKCNLIICTSVLEEGLDVPHCDLVIRYSSTASLIKYVQTRGRARRDSSRFVVFVDPEERSRIQEMEEQERIMDELLKQHQRQVGIPSKTTLDIIEQIEGSAEESERRGRKKIRKKVVDTCVLQLFVADSKNVDTDFRLQLSEELQQTQDLKIQKILVLENPDRGGTLFTPSTNSLMISARSLTPGIPAEESYHRLCQHWDFKVRGHPKVKIWSLLENQTPKRTGQIQVKWLVAKISFGNFINRQTFEESCVWEGTQIELRFVDDKHLTVKMDQGKIIVPFSILNHFALINWNKDPSAVLYLPMSTVPALMRPQFNPETDKEELVYVNLTSRRSPGDEATEILEKFARHGVIGLHLELDDSPLRLRKVLNSPDYFPIPAYDTCIEVVTFRSSRLEILRGSLYRTALTNKDLETFLWNISILKSQRYVCFADSVLTGILEFVCQNQDRLNELNQMAKNIEEWPLHSYWMDVGLLFTEMAQNFESFSVLPFSVESKTQQTVRRLIATPSRNVYYAPVGVRNNRLLRTFTESPFLIVAFRDEQLQKLHGVNSFDFVKEILQTGLYLNGRVYHYVCSSSSQLRDHKAFFVAENSPINARKIRSSIVLNQSDFRSVAQYSSRLGLFCTGVTETINIPQDHMRCIDDIEAMDGTVLTDGAGLIRASLASKLARLLQLDYTPAVFQIRIAGIKGILLVVPDDHVTQLTDAKCSIVYRKSMKKFESSHTNLGIVSWSKFIPCRLNRDVITLLDSLKFGVDVVLQERMEIALANVAQMLANTRAAVETLQQLLPQTWNLQKITQSGFNLLQEPFWLRLLQGAYDFTILDLRQRTKIPVEKAVLVLGAPDPFEMLREDEIFLQVQGNGDDDPLIVTGKVLIYRNPCLHPGDIRVVTAVDVRQLHYYKNVVLMSSRSDCRTSLAASCSGGDLDGDTFSVIWDPDLIPPLRSIRTPLDYASLAKNPPVNDRVTHPSSLANFYVNCMLNDTLGRVAHIHRALCDQLEAGACDPLAMKLAESQSVAVDFPKTGIAPEVPRAALQAVQDKGYPDFMEKDESSSYFSKKILGELYRRCCSISSEMLFTRKFELDKDLLAPGYEDFLPEAREDYFLYSKAMKRIMFQFSLTEEYEIVYGRAKKWDCFLQADAGKASQMIQESFRNLQKDFRARFKQMKSNSIPERKAKASAWYYVAYDSQERLQETQTFLSFPWVVADFLCSIRTSQKNPGNERILELSVCSDIGHSAKAYFLEHSHSLSQIVLHKTSAITRITSALNRSRSVATILPYGSVSVFLCDAASDVDIAVLPGNKDPRLFLESVVSLAIDGEVESKQLILNADHPRIKCRILEGDDVTSVDLSINPVGLKKTDIIQRMYSARPQILPVLWFLVRWARAAGIIKDNRIPADVALVPAADFYGLVLGLTCDDLHWDSNSQQPGTLTDVAGTLDSLLDRIENLDGDEVTYLGEVLISFLEKAAALRGDFPIKWQLWNDPSGTTVPDSLIRAEVIKEIARLSSNALHSLLFSRSAEYVIRSFHSRSRNQVPATFKLPTSLTNAMGNSLQFHAKRLSLLSRAEVELKQLDGQSGVVVKALGSRAEIFRLHEEIQSLLFTNRSTTLGVVQTKASRYFMMGSDLLLVCHSDSSRAFVEFTPSCGPFQLKHSALERSGIKLYSERYLGDWKSLALEKFLAHICRQLVTFPVENRKLLETLEISTRYGSYYLLHVNAALPETRRTLAIGELEEILRKSRTSRKKYLRTDFAIQDDGDEVSCEAGETSSGLVSLKPSLKNPLEQDRSLKDLKLQKRKGLASGFATGVDLHNKINPELLEKTIRIYSTALECCGFQELKEGPSYRWMACVTLSRSYEASVFMDQHLNVVKFQERDLRWIDTEILHGEELSPKAELMNHVDTRVTIATAEPIDEGSTIFKALFPMKAPSAPIRIAESGKPQIVEHFTKGPRERIVFVRHKPVYKRFAHTGGIKCEATLTSGVTYLGNNLELEQPFCKIHLRFDAEPLKEALKGVSNRTAMRKTAHDVFHLSVALAEAISQASEGSSSTVCPKRLKM